MANTYFQFKQFTVNQEHTAMKVCTDACLFGAWAARDISIQSATSIMDIGAGTGLLSLMLAQANATKEIPSTITAIEIESAAANEACSNIKASPWSERIQAVHTSIQSYGIQETTNPLNQQSRVQFDCIITNPPFYEGDLKSPDAKINLAAHSAELPWADLIQHVDRLLKENGSFFVLIPALRSYTMQKLCEASGLNLVEEVMVYNNAKNLPIRSMQKYIKNASIQNKDTNDALNEGKMNILNVNDIKRSKLYIKNNEQQYSAEFTNLLKDYYLHL